MIADPNLPEVSLVSTVEDLVYNGEREKTYEHVGIGCLTAYLRRHGYSVTTHYVNEKEDSSEAVKRILSNRSTLIGFNAYAVTINKVLEMCRLIKAVDPLVHICLGAQTPTFEDKTIIANNSAVDSIVRGEGEVTLHELAERIRHNGDLSEVKGLSFRKDGKYFRNPDRTEMVDLETLPWPARDNHGVINKNTYTIETSRGCLGRCSFCTAHDANYFGRRSWRGRSARNVVDELEHLVRTYGATMFNFVDASFEDPGEEGKIRIAQIARLILDRQLRISFVVDFRADSIVDSDSELLDLLIKAGLEGVVLGLESGHEKTLRIFNKRATVKDNERIVRILREKRLGCMHNIIMFHPYITLDGLRANVEFLRRCELGYRFEDFQTRLQVQPGVDLKASLIRDGLMQEDVDLTTDLFNYQYRDKRIKALSEAMATLIPCANLEMEFFDLNIQLFNLRMRKLEDFEKIRDDVGLFEAEIDSVRSQLTRSNCDFFLQQLGLLEQGGWNEAIFKSSIDEALIGPTNAAKRKMRAAQKRVIASMARQNVAYRGLL